MTSLDESMLFNGWDAVVRTVIIGITVYAYCILFIRLCGKRSLSKMNAFDLVITIALGSILSSVILTRSVSLTQGIIAISLLLILQFLSSALAVRSSWVNRMLKARPTLLYYRGRYLDAEMRTERVTEEDLMASVRQQGIGDLNEVDAIVLESDGSLSVVKSGLQTELQLKTHGLQSNRLV